MFKCKFCDCEVFTKNAKSEGKRSDQPNLCKGCRFGIDGHKKMKKPKPYGDV